MGVSCEMRINSSAAEGWEVLAEQFDHVSEWAVGVYDSSPLPGECHFSGTRIAGRSCVTFAGKVSEKFTEFDPEKRRFSYVAVFEDAPAYIPFVEGKASYQVKPVDNKQCVVVVDFSQKFKPVIGWLLRPLFQKFTQKICIKGLDALKYFVEHGTPHPRKRCEMEENTKRP